MKADKLLCYISVSVGIFGLDRSQTTINFEMCWSNVPVKIFSASVNVERTVHVCCIFSCRWRQYPHNFTLVEPFTFILRLYTLALINMIKGSRIT